MTPPREPVHLSSHHNDTLRKILQHPAGHNIEWKDALSLLEAVASVEEQHDGRFVVTLGDETESFERPNGKDISVQQVVDLRRMLTSAGFGDANGTAPGGSL
jgi:hypothetical protein